MMAIPDELVMAVAQPVLERMLGEAERRREVMQVILDHPEAREALLQKIADGQKSELMTTAEAAEMLRTTPQTLLENHVAWGLDVSTALGTVQRSDGRTRLTAPRFFRTQILERMHARKIAGRQPPGSEGTKVTHFPQTRRKAG